MKIIIWGNVVIKVKFKVNNWIIIVYQYLNEFSIYMNIIERINFAENLIKSHVILFLSNILRILFYFIYYYILYYIKLYFKYILLNLI